MAKTRIPQTYTERDYERDRSITLYGEECELPETLDNGDYMDDLIDSAWTFFTNLEISRINYKPLERKSDYEVVHTAVNMYRAARGRLEAVESGELRVSNPLEERAKAKFDKTKPKTQNPAYKQPQLFQLDPYQYNELYGLRPDGKRRR